MRILAAILVFGASVCAQDAPVPVIPVQTVWTVNPVAVELLKVLYSASPDPVELRSIINRLTVEELKNVVISLIGTPKTLNALVAQFDTQQIKQLSVSLLVTDVDVWVRFSELLSDPVSPNKFGSTWLDAARAHLRQRLDTEGTNPDVIAEAEAMLNRLNTKAQTTQKQFK